MRCLGVFERAVGEIGNKKVRGHGLHIFAFQSAIFVLNTHVPLVKAAELGRPEVDVPDIRGVAAAPFQAERAHRAPQRNLAIGIQKTFFARSIPKIVIFSMTSPLVSD